MRKENKFGFIEYRMPTVKEGLNLLHSIGINAETANEDWMKKNFLKLVHDMIDVIAPFVSKVEMKDGEKEISTFDEAINSCKYLGIIRDICMEIFVEINGGDEGNLKSSGE
jgi:hypothetical protein